MLEKKQLNQRFEFLWVAIALFIMILPASHPFLMGEMPRTDDGTIHVYRVIALEHAITTTGHLYPRYAPGLVYGYGSPLFNYFPPVPYYLPYGLTLLGLTYVQAWLMAMVLYTYFASIGAYLLGRVWSNHSGGFITSVAYVYAPYMLFDTVSRGTLIEYAGLAGLPFVLWSLALLARHQTRLNLLSSVIIFLIFIPLHNIVTLHGAILIAPYSLLLIAQAKNRRRTFWQLLCVGLFGVFITTFFWLPALTETNAVKINIVTTNLSNVDVTRYLRPLSDILSLPQTADITHLQAPVPITLSWISIVMSIIGLLISCILKTSQRAILSFMSIATIITIFMNTPPSAVVWETVPLLDYTQFAWRTLGIGSLTISLAMGISFVEATKLISSKKALAGVLSVLTASIMLYSLSWLYTPYIALEANSINDVHDYERRTSELSLSSYSEYLPITNQAPLDGERLRQRYAESDIIPRSEHPAIVDAQWYGTSAELSIRLNRSETLVFDWLYVEGWKAHSDDEVLLPYPQSPEGLVALDLPVGDYSITIKLEDSPLQRQANIISVIGVIVFVVSMIFLPFTQQDIPVFTVNSSTPTTLNFTQAIIITSLIIFAFKMLYVDHNQSLWKAERFANGIESGVKTPLLADLSNGLQVIGISAPESVETGGNALLEIFTRLQDNPVSTDYSSQLTLKDSNNLVIAQVNSFMPGNIATSNWIPGTYTNDVISLPIPPNTPPTSYILELHYYNPVTQEIASVVNEIGNPVASAVQLGTLNIVRSEVPITTPISQHHFSEVGLSLVDGLELPESAIVGEEILLDALWHNIRSLEKDYQLQFVWRNDSDQIVRIMPITADYSTILWQTGDVWRGKYRLITPPDLSAGTVELSLQIVSFSDDVTNIETAPIVLGEITVITPDRTYVLPENYIESGQRWRNGIELIGYDLSSIEGDTVTILTLYWRTQEALEDNLRLFVQILDDENRILAQADEVPVNWTRPTTGWANGEIITTIHQFNASFGENELWIGWYEPIQNIREITIQGDDFVTLNPIP